MKSTIIFLKEEKGKKLKTNCRQFTIFVDTYLAYLTPMMILFYAFPSVFIKFYVH